MSTTAVEGLTTAAAAERLGLSTDTLGYHEREGLLLQPVGRSASGHRRYGAEDLRWILLLTRLRASGGLRAPLDLERAPRGTVTP